MKKIKLILFSFVAILFVACTDDTNQYSNQLFTDSELNRAFRQCLTQSADSASAHLCIPNAEEMGYYNYSEGEYKIGLPANALFIADTLEIHGLGYLVDTLIRKTNYAAELCGNSIKIYFTETMSSITFQDPYRLLNGDSMAITNYFEKNYFENFKNRTQTLLSVNFATHGVNDDWQNILNIYFMLTGQVVSADFLGNASQIMSKGFIKEMKIEEALIRNDVSRRGATTSKLYEVFATID